MREGIVINLVVTYNGVEVLDCLCGDDIWRIEHCPPKSKNHSLTLQKDIKHYYKTMIISKQTDCGILFGDGTSTIKSLMIMVDTIIISKQKNYGRIFLVMVLIPLSISHRI